MYAGGNGQPQSDCKRVACGTATGIPVGRLTPCPVMYHLLSFHGFDPDINTLAWTRSDSLIVEERICLCKVKRKKREKKLFNYYYAIINLTCSVHSWSYFVMNCYMKVKLLVHFPPECFLVSISWKLSFTLLRFVGHCAGGEMHKSNDRRK